MLPSTPQNNAYDSLFKRLTEERAKAAKLYFTRLARNASASGGAGAGAGADAAAPPPPGPKLSAIESVAAKHMQKALGAYKKYLQELDVARDRRVGSVLEEFTKRIEDLKATHRAMQRMTAVTQDGVPTAPPSLARSASIADAEKAIQDAVAERDRQLADIQAQHTVSEAILVKEVRLSLSFSHWLYGCFSCFPN